MPKDVVATPLNGVVSDFREFSRLCKSRVDASKWTVITYPEHILLAKIDFKESFPKIVTSVKVFRDFRVAVHHRDIPLDTLRFAQHLDSNLRCSQWSNFVYLLSAAHDFEFSSDAELNYALHLLEKALSAKLGGPYNKKFIFLREQLEYLLTSRVKYSAYFSIIASHLYYSDPAAYSALQNTDFIALPHSAYIWGLSLDSSVLENFHLNYLKERISALSEEERFVNLQLDEIDIKSYVIPNKMNRNIEHCTPPYLNSLVTFMVSSLCSLYKDLIALYPLHNPTPSDLLSCTNEVLRMASYLGLRVVSLVSAKRARVCAMYTMMCGGTLSSCVPHPFDFNSSLFLLFDPASLLISIRNDWLTNISPAQTFVFPSFDDSHSIESACLLDLKALRTNLLNSSNLGPSSPQQKLSPSPSSLSRNILYPSSFDRNNVKHAEDLFSVKTTKLISCQTPENSGMLSFLSTVLRWWTAIRMELFKTDDEAHSLANLQFLNRFCVWLDQWNKLVLKDSCLEKEHFGKLSDETHFALLHTTQAMDDCAKYVLYNLAFPSVQLVKFSCENVQNTINLPSEVTNFSFNNCLQQILAAEVPPVQQLRVHASKHFSFVFSNLDFDVNFLEANNGGMVYEKEFPSILDLIDTGSANGNLNTSGVLVLTYIASHVAYHIGYAINCPCCLFHMFKHKAPEQDIALAEHRDKYLEVNGLILSHPTELFASICVSTLLIFFQLVVAPFKVTFLNIKSQVACLSHFSFLFNSSLHKLNQYDEVCSCGRRLVDVVRFFINGVSQLICSNYFLKYDGCFNSQKSFKRKELLE